MNNILVSIVIPTYSRPNNLCRAIDSVLAQTYKPIEIVVVDDNGKNTIFQRETEEKLDSYIKSNQIIYVCHDFNKNGSAARNTGVSVSHGKIVGLMDDDDFFMPDKISKQVATLIKKHDVDNTYQGCYCNTEVRTSNGSVVRKINCLEGDLTEELLTGDVTFNSSALIFFREAYNETNGFDERFLRHQDWEFCIRFFERFKMVLASPKETLLVKYVTPNVVSKNPSRLIEYREFFLKEMDSYLRKYGRYNEIYHTQYIYLSSLLMFYGYYMDGIRYIKKACFYKNINLKEIKKITKNILRHFYYKYLNNLNVNE